MLIDLMQNTADIHATSTTTKKSIFWLVIQYFIGNLLFVFNFLLLLWLFQLLCRGRGRQNPNIRDLQRCNKVSLSGHPMLMEVLI